MSPTVSTIHPKWIAILVLLLASVALAIDTDGDGVDDAIDVCCNTAPGIPVTPDGRPAGDLDLDCDTDLDDFAIFQASFTGPDECYEGQEECTDGINNDCDCQIDCEDADCDGQVCGENGEICIAAVCQCPNDTEICDDFADNDCDGLIDCEDPDCDGNICSAYGEICIEQSCRCEEAFETCDDFVDNDCDALVDCEDPECDGQPCGENGEICAGSTCMCPGNTEICNDGQDNDCDGLVDCEDVAGCPAGTPCGPTGEICYGQGQCGCAAPWEDCDGLPGNGCETNTDTDIDHCGECNHQCSEAHSDSSCVAGTCVIHSCIGLWGNCDGDPDDSCETPLTSTMNCGECFEVCELSHAYETCTTGTCLVSQCENGWCNDNGDHSDGCEFDLDTNPPLHSYTHLGTVRGDEPGDIITYSGKGEKWYRVYVDEADTGSTCIDLSASIRLTPAAGTDYDLAVYCDDQGLIAGSSSYSGSTPEEVVIAWEEDHTSFPVCIPTSSNSGRDIYIRVIHYDADNCGEYQLRIEGYADYEEYTCPDE